MAEPEPRGRPARAAYQASALWPGWTDNGDGRCVCSWSVLGGVRQVKFANAGCPVRHRERVR